MFGSDFTPKTNHFFNSSITDPTTPPLCTQLSWDCIYRLWVVPSSSSLLTVPRHLTGRLSSSSLSRWEIHSQSFFLLVARVIKSKFEKSTISLILSPLHILNSVLNQTCLVERRRTKRKKSHPDGSDASLEREAKKKMALIMTMMIIIDIISVGFVDISASVLFFAKVKTKLSTVDIERSWTVVSTHWKGRPLPLIVCFNRWNNTLLHRAGVSRRKITQPTHDESTDKCWVENNNEKKKRTKEGEDPEKLGRGKT